MSESTSQLQLHEADEFQSMLGAWLRAFPEAKKVSPADVEAWIDGNRDSLPAYAKSMERCELIMKLFFLQNFLRMSFSESQEKEGRSMDHPPARFQWIPPVNALLESRGRESKDIYDWIAKDHEAESTWESLLETLDRLPSEGASSVNALPPEEAPLVDASKRLRSLYGPPPRDAAQHINPYIEQRNGSFPKYEILVALEKDLLTNYSKELAADLRGGEWMG